jgi:hypothetical protein
VHSYATIKRCLFPYRTHYCENRGKRAATFDYNDGNDALLFVDRCPRLVRSFTFCASKEDYLGKTIDFVYSTFLLTVITANAAT